MLISRNPRLDFARAGRLVRLRAESDPEIPGQQPGSVVFPAASASGEPNISAGAVLDRDVQVGRGSSIGHGAVVGRGVKIGADCRIYPRVVIYPGTTLGNRVVVHAGAVLGADGFGYVRDPESGEYLQFPQQGTLVIEDDVEIGANATIDRGALEETRIGRGTKIDNLVHIGHNARVGTQVVIAAQTGVSGSSTIGDAAIVGGQVGIADHVQIGPGVILGAQAGIPSQKKLHGPGVVFWGTPARPIRGYLKELAALARLAKPARSVHNEPEEKD